MARHDDALRPAALIGGADDSRTRLRALAVGRRLDHDAGDVLTCELELTHVRVSKSRPERGIITMRTTASKSDGELAAVLVITGLFATG